MWHSEAVMEVTVTQPVSGPCQYQLHSNPSSRQSPCHLPQTPPRRSSCRDYRETLVKTTPGVKRTSSLQVHKAKRPVIGASQGRDLDPSSAGRYSDTRLNIAQWEFARPVLKNLKLKLEVRWVLQNWGKTEAFRCFLRKWKSVKNWLRYKQFSDFPNSKIFAGMLKKLAAQLSHCAMPCTRRDMRFSVFTNNI